MLLEDCFIYIIVSCKLLKKYAAPMGTTAIYIVLT